MGISRPSLAIRIVWSAEPHDYPQTEDFFHRVFHRLARLLVDDVKYGGQRMALGLAARPAGKMLRLAVEEGHPALGIGHDHPVADTRQGDGVQIFRRCKLRRALNDPLFQLLVKLVDFRLVAFAFR